MGIDINAYRDDIENKNLTKETLDVDVLNKVVILVDDVLYTGRSARAAMEAVINSSRPAKIQLATLIDRGHRELPIRPDYIGKNIPTNDREIVNVPDP